MPDSPPIPADLSPAPSPNLAPGEHSSPDAPPKDALPMLDVHPAHHAAGTWRDFFIHIATIVIGLLIAIGLEQTVEYFHHRHLAHQAREQLLLERNSNESSNEFNIFATQRHQLHLRRDLAILHAIRNHTPVPLGPFILRHVRYFYLEDEWRKIHQSGTVTYLNENLNPVDYRYENQDAFMARANRSIEDLYHAGAVLRDENQPPTETFETNISASSFLKAIADSHETLSNETVEQGFAPWAEHSDLSKLSPAQIDALEHAIQVALVDDDALLAYCFNIKRNLVRNPAK
jgi:hypothetical protein